MGRLIAISAAAGTLVWSLVAGAYPTDEYERTKIRRLEWQRQVDQGSVRGRKTDPGGRWPGSYIQLRMREAGRDYEFPPDTPKHPELQKGLEAILEKWRWRRYNVAVLDITDPKAPRFAGVNEHELQTPGSVAKVLVAAGFLEMLRQRFGSSIEKREELMRSHSVSADDWAMSDSHEVPIVSGEKLDQVSYRKVKIGDRFTLWEWMDHALSMSNNSAASTLWREATLMKLIGEEYPPASYGAELWKRWDREAMTAASFQVVDEPLQGAGIDVANATLRMYFTRGANRYIKADQSRMSPYTIVKWMLRVEQGRMVDEFSSLELKKMLYLTRRRVRYLYTDKLNDYGALFKSGSLYRFSENAPRVQYEGDLVNVLNSLIEIDTTPPPAEPTPEEPSPVSNASASDPGTTQAAVVESPAPRDPFAKGITDAKGRPYVYLVAVMSNELKRNAAMDHSKLGEAIHELIVTTP